MAESELSKIPWAHVTVIKKTKTGKVQTLTDVLIQWVVIKVPDGVFVTALMLNFAIQQCSDVNAFKKCPKVHVHRPWLQSLFDLCFLPAVI